MSAWVKAETVERVERLLRLYPDAGISEFPALWMRLFAEKLQYSEFNTLGNWALALPSDRIEVIRANPTGAITHLRLATGAVHSRADSAIIDAIKPVAEKREVGRDEAGAIIEKINSSLKLRHLLVDVPSLQCTLCHQLMVDICLFQCGHCACFSCTKGAAPFACRLRCPGYIQGDFDCVPVSRLQTPASMQLAAVLRQVPVRCFGKRCDWIGAQYKLLLHVPVCTAISGRKTMNFSSTRGVSPGRPRLEDNIDFDGTIRSLLATIQQEYFRTAVAASPDVTTRIHPLRYESVMESPLEEGQINSDCDISPMIQSHEDMVLLTIVTTLRAHWDWAPQINEDWETHGEKPSSCPGRARDPPEFSYTHFIRPKTPKLNDTTRYLPIRKGDHIEIVRCAHNSLYGYVLGRREGYTEEVAMIGADHLTKRHRVGWFPTICLARHRWHMQKIASVLYAVDYDL